MPLYTVTDENNFENNTAVTVWRITYTGYVSRASYGLGDVLDDYDIDFITYPGQAMSTIPYVKQYLKIPSDAEIRKLIEEEGPGAEFDAGTLYVVAGN